jgi:hypothetical protein
MYAAEYALLICANQAASEFTVALELMVLLLAPLLLSLLLLSLLLLLELLLTSTHSHCSQSTT